VSVNTSVELAQLRERLRNGNARATRERAHVSRAEVAADLGVHETTVEKWETGKRSPRGRLAFLYGRLLHELDEIGTR
jgi:DNA-binding transcriptional regulator YiaG